MPRRSSTVFLLVGWLLTGPGRAAEGQVPPPEVVPAPADDDRPPEAVLDAKGLYRVRNAYVLTDQPVRDLKFQELRNAAEVNELAFKPLLDEQQRLKSDTKKSNKPERREQAREVLREFEAINRADLDRYKAESERIRDGMVTLAAETRKLYETLAADPAVRRAIRTLNREHRPKVVLGPVNSPEEYRAAVLRDDVALVRERGLVADKARRWVVGLEAEVGSLGYQAHHQLDLLVAAEAAVGDNAGRASKKAKMVEKRKAVAAELETAPDDQRRRLAAELQVIDAQVRRLAPDAVEPAAFWAEKARRVAEARAAFLRSVAELRRAADAAPAARRRLEADAEVLDSLEELAGKSAPRLANRAHHVAEAVEYRHGLAALKDLEAAIRVDRVPIETGTFGAGLVAVTLNGTHPARAVVGLRADTTVVPAALAAEVGAAPDRRAELVDVALPGAEAARGRASVLRSVAVGPVTAEHVPCLVLAADSPGPASVVLGADVLDVLGAALDTAGTALEITRVVLPAYAHRTAAPATTLQP